MRLSRVASVIPLIAALGWGCTQEPASPRGVRASLSAAPDDFDYVANPPNVMVDPSIVIPDAIPFCNKAGTVICYSPAFLRAA